MLVASFFVSDGTDPNLVSGSRYIEFSDSETKEIFVTRKFEYLGSNNEDYSDIFTVADLYHISLLIYSDLSFEIFCDSGHFLKVEISSDFFGTSSDSDSAFFTSLNGKYGSYPDGVLVTVSDKTGQFTVKSSELFWNDNDSREYMLAYILADSSGNFLMVPDIHVTAV